MKRVLVLTQALQADTILICNFDSKISKLASVQPVTLLALPRGLFSISIRSQVKRMTQPEPQAYRVFQGTLQVLHHTAKQATTAQATNITSACRCYAMLAMLPKRDNVKLRCMQKV